MLRRGGGAGAAALLSPGIGAGDAGATRHETARCAIQSGDRLAAVPCQRRWEKPIGMGPEDRIFGSRIRRGEEERRTGRKRIWEGVNFYFYIFCTVIFLQFCGLFFACGA